MQNKDVGVT